MGKSAQALKTEDIAPQKNLRNEKAKKNRGKKRSHHLISADRLCWIQNIARKLQRSMQIPAYEYDELVAAGYLGLVEATERYRPSCGTSFKAYAYLRIRGAIIDSIRQNSYLSRRGYHLAKAIQAAYDVRNNSSVTGSSKSESLSQITEYLAKGALAFQLSFADEEDHLSAESGSSNAELLLQKKEQKTLLLEAMETLPAKEKLVLKEYYFEGKTFTEIAEDNDITRPWASKLHKKALEHLKKNLAEEDIL